MPERTIVAIGGGDLGPVLDYVIGLVRERPNLLWVGTAGAEDPWTALQIHDRFQGRADVRRLEFFPWPPENLRELVLSQDVRRRRQHREHARDLARSTPSTGSCARPGSRGSCSPARARE